MAYRLQNRSIRNHSRAQSFPARSHRAKGLKAPSERMQPMRWIDNRTAYQHGPHLMNEMTANYLREHMKAVVNEVVANHDVLRITRRKGSDFVVIGAEDWEAIAETLYLNQVPGLVSSIQAAAKELEDLDW